MPVWLGSGTLHPVCDWARAGMAIATIIAAMTNATTTNNIMRLISATSFTQGGVLSPAG